MLKIIDKIRFTLDSNRMKKMGDVKNAINQFKTNKNKNLYFLLKNRFSWMNEFINSDDIGLEVGAGAGFSKHFIASKNFKICDIENHEHLDLKKMDAQNTGLSNNSVEAKIFFFLSILKYKKSLTSYSKSNQEPLLGITLQLNNSLPLA